MKHKSRAIEKPTVEELEAILIRFERAGQYGWAVQEMSDLIDKYIDKVINQFENTSYKLGYKPLDFIKDYNHISPLDLEEILETLEDCGYLSKEGKEFRTELWKLFVKETNGQATN